MKKLFIIRHAKSNQSFLGNDFERPLNDRGLKDATEMARRLIHSTHKIDALVSSPAIRAKMTAGLFADTLQIQREEIIFVTALYHAPAEVFYEVIAELPRELQSVAIFSHNPGITHFVNSLDTDVQTDNMPTCANFAVVAAIDHWADFERAPKTCLFFDYPKLQ